MKRKIKILRLINSIDPKFGGPANAIISSSLILLKQNFKVDILTSDKKNSNFFKSKKIKIINKGTGIISPLFGFNLKFTLWLLKNRHKYDLFIVHGLWSYCNIIARLLLKKKYYVFIHGFLDPFFKVQFFKKIKKQIYWFLIERQNSKKANSILLTSKGEYENLNKTFVNTNDIKKKIIKYGIVKPKLSKKKILRFFILNFQTYKIKTFCYFLADTMRKRVAIW